MAAHLTVGILLDLLSDELARTSGLLLSIGEVQSLSPHLPDQSFQAIVAGPMDAIVSRASDIYAELARALRVAIGNLPNDEPPIARRMAMMRTLTGAGHDVGRAVEAFGRLAVERPNRILGAAEVEAVRASTGLPRFVVHAALLMIADHLQNEASLFTMATSLDWDGVVPLARLFDAEHIASDPALYIDQRFIDYLAVREEKLAAIHWRNFERLCAEFFKRVGFQVVLGPGRADGGVDLRVFRDGDSTTPVLLVQCKRYASGSLVSVEAIKALWSDVQFEGAEGGLIATTARVSPEGARIATARGYPLTFAERGRVQAWATSMWRYSFNGPGTELIRGTALV